MVGMFLVKKSLLSQAVAMDQVVKFQVVLQGHRGLKQDRQQCLQYCLWRRVGR